MLLDISVLLCNITVSHVLKKYIQQLILYYIKELFVILVRCSFYFAADDLQSAIKGFAAISALCSALCFLFSCLPLPHTPNFLQHHSLPLPPCLPHRHLLYLQVDPHKFYCKPNRGPERIYIIFYSSTTIPLLTYYKCNVHTLLMWC